MHSCFPIFLSCILIHMKSIKLSQDFNNCEILNNIWSPTPIYIIGIHINRIMSIYSITFQNSHLLQWLNIGMMGQKCWHFYKQGIQISQFYLFSAKYKTILRSEFTSSIFHLSNQYAKKSQCLEIFGTRVTAFWKFYFSYSFDWNLQQKMQSSQCVEKRNFQNAINRTQNVR